MRKRVGQGLRTGHSFTAGWAGKREVLLGKKELGSNSLGDDLKALGIQEGQS